MADDNKTIKDSLFTDEEILNHDYDGIMEMNNGMPFWLTGLFLGSIIWGIIYYLHYTSGSGPNSEMAYQSKMAAFNAQVAESEASTANIDYFSELNNPEGISHGLAVYKLRCAACHGMNGEGGIGPNLADAYWLHGDASTESIAELVDKGITEKGMPAWGQILSKKDVVATAVFIKSIAGTSPAGGKAPQGKEIN